jgi:hypothetical protein
LDGSGEGSRQSVHVKLGRVVAFRLQEKLMALGIGKLYDLVFN